jgi:protein SCO1/2
MKTITLLLFLIATFAFGAEPPTNAAKDDGCACCAKKPISGKDDCCAGDKNAAAKTDACLVRHSLGEGGCEAMAALPADMSAKASAPAEALAKEDAPFSKESIYQLDAKFTDDSGRPFALGELRGRPVVLDMFFASCGYACPLLVTDMQAIQGKLPAGLRGKAVFVLVSFDVARDTPAALAQYRAQRSLDGQWILLHGDDDAVRELAALLGVKYKREADGAFSHSNILTILNPQGEIIQQRTGLKGGLDEAAAALVQATK